MGKDQTKLCSILTQFLMSLIKIFLFDLIRSHIGKHSFCTYYWSLFSYNIHESLTGIFMKSFRPFYFKILLRNILTHSPETNFKRFFASYSSIFPFLKCGSQNPTHLLHTFSIFGPPTFRCWFKSVHEVPIRLKISAGDFPVH